LFDIHCHILYGVDDGASDLAESLAMLEAAQAVRIDHIVCTPHCRGRQFDLERIRSHYQVFASHAQEQGMQTALGLEVFWRKLAEIGLDNAHSLCIEGTDLLLLEFSLEDMPVNWQGFVTGLQKRGIQPIIAHPERYAAVQKDIGLAIEMKELGCLLQLSSDFANDSMLSPRRQTAMKLLQLGAVDYLASDAHQASGYAAYAKALELARA